MGKSPVLSVHVGTDLKQGWEIYCARRNTTPSAAIRQIVSVLLAKAASPVPLSVTEHEDAEKGRYRIELRLTGSELSKVTALAERDGTSPNRLIVNLIRGYLTRQPQFGMNELRILGESNSQLMAIGRNLNQIARWMNANEGSGSAEIQRINALYRDIKDHTDKVTDLMRSNIDRWTIR